MQDHTTARSQIYLQYPDTETQLQDLPEPVRLVIDPDTLPKPLYLDMGSGDQTVEGYVPLAPGIITVDPYTTADIHANMWDIPLPDGCVDAIYSTNSLEHISKFQIIPTLREWNRLLKDGGQLKLAIPDLEWAVRFWLELKDSREATGWPLDIIYGHQKHDGEYHKTGFTEKILWDYLTIANPGGWYVSLLKTDGGRNDFDDDGITRTYKNVRQGLITLIAFKVDLTKLI